MSLWLLLTLALLVQEGVTTTVLLLEAYQQHYPLILIHLIWLVVTVFQIYAGYYVGKWIQKRFAGTKFESWLKKSAHSLEKHIGASGESIALVLVSGIISPVVAALGASWLEISFTRVLIFAGIGDLLWYLSEWITILGLTKLISGAKVEIGVVAIGLIVVALLLQFVRKVK
jgi:membrane protein YqaA with SNARE-associated domain